MAIEVALAMLHRDGRWRIKLADDSGLMDAGCEPACQPDGCRQGFVQNPKSWGVIPVYKTLDNSITDL
jgi:hypothetical protein